MKITRCDICNHEMRNYIFDRDSETQYYTLINKYAGRDLETDICNGCMHKLIDFVNAPSVVLDRAEGEWIIDEPPSKSHGTIYICPFCGHEENFKPTNYCSACGEKMKGAE